MLIPQAMTDLNHLEDSLKPSSIYSVNDRTLLENLINYSSRFILRYTNRSKVKYHTVTDQYTGDGTDVLLLHDIPVISISSVYMDANRAFGSDSLVETDYYVLEESEYGQIRFINKAASPDILSIKVTYVAGYSSFPVFTGYSDQLTLTEDTTSFTVNLNQGDYTASSLATEFQTRLNAAGAYNYTVSFSEASQRLAISAGSAFSLSWSGTREEECARVLGFDIDSTQTSATVQYSDFPLLGIPADLIGLCNAFVLWRYEEVKERRSGKFSESRGDSSYSFDYSNIPNYVRETLDQYRLINMK